MLKKYLLTCFLFCCVVSAGTDSFSLASLQSKLKINGVDLLLGQGLVIESDLDSGFYTLKLVFDKTQKRSDFVVRLDHREIAFYSGYFGGDNNIELPVYEIDFAISTPGKHLIEISRDVRRYIHINDKVLTLLDADIVEREKPAWDDIYNIINSNQSLCPLWGWMPSSNYQRQGNKRLSMNYWRKRIVDESYAWGSNFLQLYPFANRHYIADGNIVDAVEYAHNKGFIVDQHSSWSSNDSLMVHWKDDKSIETLFENMDYRVSKFMDVANLPLNRVVDGWESEGYSADINQLPFGNKANVVKCNQITWQYHPGSYISKCNALALNDTRKDYWYHEGFTGPSFVKITICAGRPFGNDDMSTLSPFPDDLAFRNRYNDIFRTCQADARPYTPNKFSGGTMNDWIAKQFWDYFRLNAFAMTENRLPLSAGLIWLGEPLQTLPEEMRHSLYGISLEPCRGAVAYELASTGRDGRLFWNYWRYKSPEADDGNGDKAKKLWKDRIDNFRPREIEPATVYRTHNGILAVDCSSFSNKMSLYWDSTGLGEFDINSKKLLLLENLFEDKRSQKNTALEIDIKTASSEVDVEYQLPPGCYEILPELYEKNNSYYVEFYSTGQYLGAVMPGMRENISFVVPDKARYTLTVRPENNSVVPAMKLKFRQLPLKQTELLSLGRYDDSGSEFKEVNKNKNGFREIYDLKDVRTQDFTSAISGTGLRAVDLMFDGDAGGYMLVFRAKADSDFQRLDVTLNSHLFGENPDFNRFSEEKLAGFVPNDWRNEAGKYGRAGSVVLDSQWKTYQVPIICSHISGNRRFKFELSVPENDGSVEFDYISIAKLPVQYKTGKFGGHTVELTRQSQNSVNVQLVADEPAVYVKTNTDVFDGINADSYENVKLSAKDDSGVPRVITLNDSDAILPTIKVVLLDKGDIESISSGKNGIVFTSKDISDKIELVYTLRTDDEQKLLSYYTDQKLADKDRSFSGELAQNAVKLVELDSVLSRPVFVQENGWWGVRGVQNICTDEKKWRRYLLDVEKQALKDFNKILKVPYDKSIFRMIACPGQTSSYQISEYIDDVVRPGTGSQKLMLIKNVRDNSCLVKVLSVNPYVYAPRLEFKENFNRVRVNGQEWSYFDGKTVFLPQKSGLYRVSISMAGSIQPRLIATCASVEKCTFEKNKLKISLRKPAYVREIPAELNYTIAVKYDSRAFDIKQTQGCRLLRYGSEAAIFECSSSDIQILFKKK